MPDYILFIHNDAKSTPKTEEWESFLQAAKESGTFRGGSEIADRETIGSSEPVKSSAHICGYMRFNSENKQRILTVLKHHPVVLNGGSVELCDMPES